MYQDLILLSASAGDPSTMTNFIFIGMMFIILYFFMIRPQAKKQKEQTNFMDALEKGHKVVTTSGIHGRVMKIEDNVVQLEIAKNTYITIEKSAVSKELSENANATTEG